MKTSSETLRSPLARRRFFALLTVLALFLLAAFLPYRQSLRAPFYFAPTAVWTLRCDGSGQIAGVWQNPRLGSSIKSTLIQLERPDVAEFSLREDLREGSRVRGGDVIGRITSRELSHELAIAEAELGVSLSTVGALQAGARSEDIAVEQEALNAAIVARETYQPEYDRIRTLYERSLIAASEYEIASAQIKSFSAAVDVCEARLRAAQAGGRGVDIAVAESEVKRTQASVARAASLLGEGQDVAAPFTGILHLCGNSLELVVLSRTDTVDAVITLPESYGALIKNGQSVVFSLFADPDNLITAAVDTIEFAAADSVGLRLHALIPNDGTLRCGMGGFAEMKTAPLTLLQSLRLRMGGARHYRIF